MAKRLTAACHAAGSGRDCPKGQGRGVKTTKTREEGRKKSEIFRLRGGASP